MSTQSPTLSVIVNSWNGLPFLKTYIRSFRDHTPEEVELCIALDGCGDGSREYAQSLGYKWVWDSHRGVSYSLNKAAELATGEYYFWSSNDYVFSEGWYDRLQKYLHPHNYITVDLVEPQEKSSFHPGAYFGTSPGEFDYPGFLEYVTTRPSLIDNRLGFAFGNGVFHSERWKEVVGFDTIYDPYGTMDIDFIYSMYKNDPDMLFFCPRDVSLYHFVRGTVRDNPHVAVSSEIRREASFRNKHGVGIEEAYLTVWNASSKRHALLNDRGVFLL